MKRVMRQLTPPSTHPVRARQVVRPQEGSEASRPQRRGRAHLRQKIFGNLLKFRERFLGLLGQELPPTRERAHQRLLPSDGDQYRKGCERNDCHACCDANDDVLLGHVGALLYDAAIVMPLL
jgi:hypothetical protein